MIVLCRRCGALAAAVFLIGVSGAGAQSLDRDSVTGESGGEIQGSGTPVAFRLIHVFDASSGPAGETATGTVRIDLESRFGRSTFATYNVVCLSVVGNQATIGGTAVGNPSPLPANVLFYVEDGVGGAPDRVGDWPQSDPPTCPAPPFDEARTSPGVTGDLTIHDAVPLPSSPRQCFGGAWQRYGFTGLGKCLAFVFKARLCDLLEQRLGHPPSFCPPSPPAGARSGT
jgi:hypothetical protein